MLSRNTPLPPPQQTGVPTSPGQEFTDTLKVWLPPPPPYTLVPHTPQHTLNLVCTNLSWLFDAIKVQPPPPPPPYTTPPHTLTVNSMHSKVEYQLKVRKSAYLYWEIIKCSVSCVDNVYIDVTNFIFVQIYKDICMHKHCFVPVSNNCHSYLNGWDIYFFKPIISYWLIFRSYKSMRTTQISCQGNTNRSWRMQTHYRQNTNDSLVTWRGSMVTMCNYNYYGTMRRHCIQTDPWGCRLITGGIQTAAVSSETRWYV